MKPVEPLDTTTEDFEGEQACPLTVLIDWAEALQYAVDEAEDGLLRISMPGRFGGYILQFNWQEDVRFLKGSCTFENIRPQKKDFLKLAETLTLLNPQFSLGHFNVFPEAEYSVAFCFSLFFHGEKEEHLYELAERANAAAEICDMVYPILFAVLTGEKSPHRVVREAIFETVGMEQ